MDINDKKKVLSIISFTKIPDADQNEVDPQTLGKLQTLSFHKKYESI